MKRVLLTGGLGYIGSHTAVVLAGFDVVLYDNLSNSKRSVLDRLESITGVQFPFVEGGVRDTALLEETLRSNSIEAVIHCFEGEGIDEVAIVERVEGDKAPALKVGQAIVKIDPRYFRPTEVETLLGDPSKAKAKLGWTPESRFGKCATR